MPKKYVSLEKLDRSTRFALLLHYAFVLASAFLLLPTLWAQEAEPSGREIVDALQSAFGEHHARAVHIKGEIVTGTFLPSGEGTRYTVAPHLQKSAGLLKVIACFADCTGIPDISDLDPNFDSPASPKHFNDSHTYDQYPFQPLV